mgnify:FL=1
MNGIFRSSLFAAVIALPNLAQADPWAIVASGFTDDTQGDVRDAIYSIDIGKNGSPKVYGPFLQGELGESSNDIFDVAVLPNHTEALVTLFGASRVLRINISNPKKPVVTGAVDLTYDTVDENGDPVTYGLFAEDIAVSPDGSLAIVSDGGFSPYLAFIDLKEFKLKSIQLLQVDDPASPGDKISIYANACAIASDNKTVLLADYYNSSVSYGKLQWSKDSLYDIKSLFLCDQVDPADATICLGTQSAPVNIAISPNGKTAIVASASATLDPAGASTPAGGLVNVLQITSPGVVVAGKSFILDGLPVNDNLNAGGPGGNQSVAFGSNTWAYVLTQPSYDDVNSQVRKNRLAKLKITAPGKGKVVNSNLAPLASEGTSQLFGVDTLDVGASNRYILTSNPTQSGGTNILTLIDQNANKLTGVPLRADAIPVGVAFK